jgi:hypothetical protein
MNYESLFGFNVWLFGFAEKKGLKLMYEVS